MQNAEGQAEGANMGGAQGIEGGEGDGTSHSISSTPLMEKKQNAENQGSDVQGRKIQQLKLKEKQHMKETVEDESIEANHDDIGRSGDLSLNQIKKVKGKNKKGTVNSNQPSQINTRGRKATATKSLH